MSVITNPAAASAGTSIGGAVVGGTAGSVLFINPSAILAQDNANFFWDDTNFNLKINGSATGQGIYFTTGFPALFCVVNASGNNWFEDNAGNHSVTGNTNLGTGDQCLQALSTGSRNTAYGAAALFSLTTGNDNTAFGENALGGTQTDTGNFAIGSFALHDLGLAGAGGGTNIANFALGTNAALHISTGDHNVVIGFGSLPNATGHALQNTIIGALAGNGLGNAAATITSNTLVGYGAAANLNSSSSGNTWVGGFQGPSSNLGNTIAISDSQFFLLDSNLLTAQAWSISTPGSGGTPTAFHVYNSWDGSIPATTYERGILDWHATANVFRLSTQAAGTGTVRLIAIDGFQKAGAPAAGDLPSGTWGLINDTSGGNTWLVYNNAGTIRKVQLI